MRYVVALLVWAAAIAGAASLSSVVAGSIHGDKSNAATVPAGATTTSFSSTTSVTTSISSSSVSSSSSAASFDAGSVQAEDGDSLFLTANFQKGMDKIRSRFGANAEIDNFALYPGYMALIVSQHGTASNVYYNAAGTFYVNGGGSTAGLTGFSISHITDNAPSALIDRIEQYTHIPQSKINYLVAGPDPVKNDFRWLIYPAPGQRFEYLQARSAGGRLTGYDGQGYVRLK